MYSGVWWDGSRSQVGCTHVVVVTVVVVHVVAVVVEVVHGVVVAVVAVVHVVVVVGTVVVTTNWLTVSDIGLQVLTV